MGYHQINQTIPISPSQQQQQQPIFDLPPLPKHETSGFNLNDKVSPSVFLIIIILAIIFFISGLLHLLIRFFFTSPRRTRRDIFSTDEMNDVNATAFEGQLQQLFHLHDSGVDQAFIDTLPLFNYKSILGVKSPFDCAVCLSEFEPEDKLRLIPKCSHAFHMDCIDTWLLSHSTCPLCRATLFPDFPSSSHTFTSPVVLVLESGSESSRENGGVVDREPISHSHSHLSACSNNESCEEIQLKEDENGGKMKGSGDKIVQVKLGKFRNVDGEGCSESENNVEQRRCFSMGSFAYIMDENSSLKVPIRTPMKKISSKKSGLPLTLVGHRAAMSECGWDSRREFNGFEAFKIEDSSSKKNVLENKAIGSGKESFSFSKIWLRGRKEKENSAIGQTSRRAFSSRFPSQRSGGMAVIEESKGGDGGGGGGGEVESERWENGGSELSYDVEMQSCNSMDSQAHAPSFGRKTLLWLMGNVKQNNKVVHSSFSSDL